MYSFQLFKLTPHFGFCFWTYAIALPTFVVLWRALCSRSCRTASLDSFRSFGNHPFSHAFPAFLSHTTVKHPLLYLYSRSKEFPSHFALGDFTPSVSILLTHAGFIVARAPRFSFPWAISRPHRSSSSLRPAFFARFPMSEESLHFRFL